MYVLHLAQKLEACDKAALFDIIDDKGEVPATRLIERCQKKSCLGYLTSADQFILVLFLIAFWRKGIFLFKNFKRLELNNSFRCWVIHGYIAKVEAIKVEDWEARLSRHASLKDLVASALSSFRVQCLHRRRLAT
jgi:hypothetical protein